MNQKKEFAGISELTLRVFAMTTMLLDHLWATLVPGQMWMTMLGRLTFPIFAFLLVEGYFHTRNLKRYFLRMLVFALISEIPFNLMQGGGILYPYHQNVIWTLLIALTCLWTVETVRKKGKLWLTALTFLGTSLLGFVLGTLAMVDYFGYGVLMVMVFYLFRGRKWWQCLGQFAGLYVFNAVAMGGRVIPLTLFGLALNLPVQGLALLALIPIWLYRGRQGPHSRAIQYACYAFYPVHILVLSLLALA